MGIEQVRSAAEAYVVKQSDIQRRSLSRLDVDWSDLEAAFMAGANWRDAQIQVVDAVQPLPKGQA